MGTGGGGTLKQPLRLLIARVRHERLGVSAEPCSKLDALAGS